MKAGDLVQAQRRFWAHEIGSSSSGKPYASKLAVSPGDLLLLIDFEHGNSDYPIYDYFTIKFFAAGSRWTTTTTIHAISEVEDYIQDFESPKLSSRG